MSAFDKINKKGYGTIKRAYWTDQTLYEKLQYLSKNVYQTSITQLVNEAIQNLVLKENITLYSCNEKIDYINRSYMIRSNLVDELDRLRSKYNIAIYKLVNIAIYNALKEEEIL